MNYIGKIQQTIVLIFISELSILIKPVFFSILYILDHHHIVHIFQNILGRIRKVCFLVCHKIDKSLSHIWRVLKILKQCI